MSAIQDNSGKCYTYRGLKFYAKNGFICLHDEETGEFFVLTRKEFLFRAQALSDEAKHLRGMSAANPGKKWLAADRIELQQAIEQIDIFGRDAALSDSNKYIQKVIRSLLTPR